MKKSKQKIKSRILSFTKKKGPDKSVSPSEVTKNLFTDIWKNHVDEVRTISDETQSDQLRQITQDDKDLPLKEAKGPIHLTPYRPEK